MGKTEIAGIWALVFLITVIAFIGTVCLVKGYNAVIHHDKDTAAYTKGRKILRIGTVICTVFFTILLIGSSLCLGAVVYDL